MKMVEKRRGRGELYILLILQLLLFSCNSPEKRRVENPKPTSVNLERGKQLFLSCCTSCHKVNQDMTGPALKNAENRWPDKEKLYAFIRNSEEVIRNDKYARELWLQYNQTLMQAQPDLTDTDIRAVLDYVAHVSEK